MAGLNAVNMAAIDTAARHSQRQELLTLNAYDRHKRMVRDLSSFYGGALPENPAGALAALVKTDEDTLRESYRFIRTAEDDANGGSWAVRLAKRYYSRLYREYCIADLSRYKEGKLGLRWRTEKEVVAGRGHFSCGARGCEEKRSLASFEVPFGYEEAGQRKQALVKVRLCPQHAYELNYKSSHAKAEKQSTKQARKEGSGSTRRKQKRRRGDISSKNERDSSSSEESGDSDSDSSGEEKVSGKRQRRSKKSKKEKEKARGAPKEGEGAATAAAAVSDDEELFAGLFE